MSATTTNEQVKLFTPGRTFACSGENFNILSFLEGGGTSEVYTAKCGVETYAVKITFPDDTLMRQGTTYTDSTFEKLSTFVKWQVNEYEALRAASHPNIVRVVAQDFITLNQLEIKKLQGLNLALGDKVPVMVMEHVEGVTLNKAVQDGTITSLEAVHALRDIASALDYIHEHLGVLHNDVRPSNVLIEASSKRAKLIDFGAAKNLKLDAGNRNQRTRLWIDPARVPDNPEIWRAYRAGEFEDITREALHEKCFPHLDIYNFGQLVKWVVGKIADSLPDDTVAYLRHASSRFSDYPSCRAYRGRLEPLISKVLSGTRDFFVPGPNERQKARKNIPLPGGPSVILDGALLDLYNSRSFRRLARFNQLSFVSEIYPGATYTRALHSLTTYRLAYLGLTHLLSVPEFRFLFEPVHIRQFLAVALCHDINHFPFLHIVQEITRAGITNRSTCDLFGMGELTGERERGEASVYDLLDQVDLSPDRFARIAYGKPSDQDSDVDCVMNSLISSGADFDKISYLTQDSFFSGVVYGQGIPVEALLGASLIAKSEVTRNRYHLAFDDRARDAVEMVFMSRFWNFRKIYWHHTNRAIMAMVLHVIRSLMRQNGDTVLDYITASAWLSDMEAIQWLDRRYEQQFHMPSVLNQLSQSRRSIYKRLYSVRADGKGSLDDELYEAIVKLVGGEEKYDSELALRADIATRLNARYGLALVEADVLFDVPRRGNLNDPGEAFLVSESGVVPLKADSRPIAGLSENYKRLTQRVRVFISPSASDVITPQVRREQRAAIGQLVAEAVRSVQQGRSLPQGVS